MQRISTCLWFDRNGAGMPLPAGTVLTVAFMLDGCEFLALNGGPVFQFGRG